MAGVLITGSSGLIGRWVRALWPPDRDYFAVAREDHDLLSSGVFASLVKERQPDAVLHLAWSAGGTQGYRTSVTNAAWCSATLEAAAACRAIGADFYGVGTILDDLPPGDAYSASKAALRQALSVDIDAGAMTWFRPHYVFDPRAERPAVVQAAMAATRARRPVDLRDPTATHDFIHAADVASAMVEATRARLRGVVDIGSGKLRTVTALVEACGATWGSSTRGGSVHDHRVATIAPLTQIGWAPTTTESFFADG